MSKVSKRKYPNGTISWSYLLVGLDGKRIRKSGFRTKTEAEIALAKIETDVDQGSYVSSDKSLTFEKAAQDFTDYHADIRCKPSTLASYNSNINKHLTPTFGNLKLVDITPFMIEKFIQVKFRDEKLSEKTVNNCITLMRTIIQRAVNNGALYNNPVSKVNKLTVQHQEMRFLGLDEINTVLDTTKQHYSNFYPLLYTAVYTGMRRGELLGLTWDRINWQNSQIYVNKSLYRNILLSPKTPSSIRKINITAGLLKILREWKLKCPNGKMNLVFPDSNGNPMDADNMIHRFFKPMLGKAKIDTIRFHDLRHTYASLLISKNVPIKYIQSQLGHSSIQVTMDRYGHLMQEVHDLGINALVEIESDLAEKNKKKNKKVKVVNQAI